MILMLPYSTEKHGISQTAPIMRPDTTSTDTIMVPPSVTAIVMTTPTSDVCVALSQRNIQMIIGKYAKLLKNASSRLQSIVSIDEFRVFVISSFPPGDCIPDSASVHEIFCAISKNGLWDCINYFPLKSIIEEFASQDALMSEWVKQYEEARSGYMLCTKISDHIDMVSVSDSSDIDSDEQLEEKPAKYDPRYYRKLSLKVKAEVTELSMQYVCELWESLASYYHLPPLPAILDSIHAGCILVTWLVPTKLTLELIEKARANLDFFQMHNVLWAKVGDDEYLCNSKDIQEPVNMLAQRKVSVICCSAK